MHHFSLTYRRDGGLSGLERLSDPTLQAFRSRSTFREIVQRLVWEAHDPFVPCLFPYTLPERSKPKRVPFHRHPGQRRNRP